MAIVIVIGYVLILGLCFPFILGFGCWVRIGVGENIETAAVLFLFILLLRVDCTAHGLRTSKRQGV